MRTPANSYSMAMSSTVFTLASTATLLAPHLASADRTCIDFFFTPVEVPQGLESIDFLQVLRKLTDAERKPAR
jgi:hypothetical protein